MYTKLKIISKGYRQLINNCACSVEDIVVKQESDERKEITSLMDVFS